jgi:hypothetical protein
MVTVIDPDSGQFTVHHLGHVTHLGYIQLLVSLLHMRS